MPALADDLTDGAALTAVRMRAILACNVLVAQADLLSLSLQCSVQKVTLVTIGKLMLEYYEQRQPEYESIYNKPERQHDLAWLEHQLAGLASGKRVLEIACGTGFWTRRMAKVATTVHATDASQQLASFAAESCPSDNVTTGTLDAYDVPSSPDFDCLVIGYLLSGHKGHRMQIFLAGYRCCW